ncbi:MAG TPA: hypothetical protein VD993_02240 [Chitinophagaceae bacterium]|nr:hypothetical protein [Chitinophagaceae bacterium]
MTGDLQYRLYNISIDPPVDAWPKIVEQLDNAAREQISHKLQDAALDPPAKAWQNIAAALDESNTSKVIPIARNWKRLAVAASVIAVIAVGAMLYFKPANTANTAGNTSTQAKDTPIVHNPVPSNTDDDNSNKTNVAGVTASSRDENTNRSSNPVKLFAFTNPGSTTVRYAHIDVAEITVGNAEDETEINESIVQYASLEPEARVGPQDYLTIIAPNGQPVRISAKFTDAVGFVFTDAPTESIDMAIKSISWKQRFRSWSNKLMSNAAFMPAATNFLDIIELEQLLKE